MNRWLNMILVGLAGCASASNTGETLEPGGPPPTIRRELNNDAGYEFVIDRDARVVSSTVSLDPDRAWPAMMAAYRDLGIPLGSIDTKARTLGNPALTAQGHLAGAPISVFLNCGTILAGPVANTHRVQISITSSLHPVGSDSTRIETRIAATAVDPSSSGNPANCTTTGTLEKRIVAQTFTNVLAQASPP